MAIWNGATKLAETSLSGDTLNQAIFNLSSGAEIVIPKGATVLTLTADFSDYNALTEGSTMSFSIGSTTDADDLYITAQGVSSGGVIGVGSIVMDAQRIGNEMWLYATKPIVSLNGASPSGAQSVGSAKEVLRFDVKNDGVVGLDIDAIRFTLGTNASSAAFDKTFNLFKSTDLNTSLGTAFSWGAVTLPSPSTTTISTGYVTIYPNSGFSVSPGSTNTYVLKGNTNSMNEVGSKAETLVVSIEDGDFYWDDSTDITGAALANQKVPNLSVTGGTLSY
jgi:hypothetical protein